LETVDDKETKDFFASVKTYDKRRKTKILNDTKEKARGLIAALNKERDLQNFTEVNALKAELDNIDKIENINEAEGVVKKLEELEYKIFFYKTFQNKSFGLASILSSQRLVYRPGFFKKIKNASGSTSITSARNEYEGFQIIVLSNPDKDIKNMTVELSDLTGESGKVISSENLSWGWVKSIETGRPDIAVEFYGKIPDVIMEDSSSFSVEKCSFMSVYIRVYVPENVPSGKYSGKIKVKGDGVEQDFSLNLNVHNFTLPEKSSLKLAFSFFEQFYCDWYGVDKLLDAQKRYIYDWLLKYRISPNNIYAKGQTYPKLKFVDEYKNEFNFYTFGVPGVKMTLKQQVEFAVQSYSEIKKKKLQDDAYYYRFDEVVAHKKGIPAAKKFMPMLRKAMPDVKFMQTSMPNEEVVDLFNVWVPLFDYFVSKENVEMLNNLKSQGHEIWWYAADGPTKPCPNFFLDYPVFDCRVIMTLSYMYNVKGVLYWCINREWKTNQKMKVNWPEENWAPYIYSAISGKRKYKNGMGNFVYPGKGGQLLPSLRIENVRDGVEDYEYIMVLKNKYEKLKTSKSAKAKALLKQAKALLTVPATVATSIDSYSGDPKKLLSYRKNIATLIDNINKLLMQE
jgi:hypothetical protein